MKNKPKAISKDKNKDLEKKTQIKKTHHG